MNKILRKIILANVIVICFHADSFAQITSITVDNMDFNVTPLQTGGHYFFPHFGDLGYPLDSLKWEVKCLMPGATNGNYTTLYAGTDTSPTYIGASHYGAHRIRCTATYGVSSGNPVPPPTKLCRA
jgi:hypothetical protein